MGRQWLGWKYAILVIGLMALAFLVMDFNNRMANLRRLSDQRDVVATEVAELVQTKTSLETQIAFATSDAAVQGWAYQEGRWVREGDVLVVPLSPEQSTPVVTVAPISTPTPESNWKIWIALFFDQRSSEELPTDTPADTPAP